MLVRALAILFAVVSASIALTMHFGQDVLIALGLILVQLKIIAKKIVSIELPAILTWLKAETATFFRIELLKKWAMTTLLPLLVGNALIKKFSAWIGKYREAIRGNYDALLNWYMDLDWPVQIVAALIVLFALLGLSVSSIGLWLILFSVKLPFWLLAAFSSLVQMTWLTIRKMAFKTVAFLQLGWLWRFIQNRLPQSYLEKKRRFDFRVARAVVRRRRMTVRQLASSKDSLSMRLEVLRERWRQRRQ
ncbi:MAG: hypothetical protein OXQ92_09515 [Boseongicola sp.]|nr:hypothetical protein [Boseongicola sp.]MDD9976239.1 hypothetical protein [Boseongicola sp.]